MKTAVKMMHTLALLSADELKIVMRTADYDEDSKSTNPPRAYSNISTDGGHTWSAARPEPDLHNAKSKGYFGRALDGTHI